MKRKIIILVLLIISPFCFTQRNFFFTNKTIMKCDSSVLHFDDDTLILHQKLYWKVGNKEYIFINNKKYYLFVFSTESPNDTIGFIRYENHKIYIIPNKMSGVKEEQLLFSFTKNIKKWKVQNIYGFENEMRFVRTYFDRHYNENIFVIKINAFPIKTTLGELYVGLKSGVVKAVYYTHYTPLNLNCALIDD